MTSKFSPGLLAGALLLLSLPTVAATAQSRQAAGDSLIRLALASARAGDTSSALRLLDRATRAAPNYAPAHYQRGVLLSRTTQLGMSDILRRREAAKALNRALDLDRDNPFYILELGRIRLKTPFLRLDAERLFKKALRSAEERGDPAVLAEIHWELGQIHERRYLTMAGRHMTTGSASRFDPNEALDDWRYTRDFLTQMSAPLPEVGELDFRRAEEHYRAALATDPGHIGAAVGLFTLLYDAMRYEEMARLARELLQHQPNETRLLFALGLALHRMDRDAEAKPIFERAVALLPASERRDMVGLQTILRRESAAAYDTLSDLGRAALDSIYWDLADPLKLTEVNEAQVEFFARVAYADLRFSSPEFNTQGWKTDRGIVVLRYGEPPMVATFAPETSEIEGSDAIGRVTTVWYYPDSRLRFVFVGPPAMNYAFFAGDFRSFAENARHIAPVSFENLKSRVRIDSVPVQIARFRADTGAVAEVTIYADVPTGKMLREVDLARAQLETGLFLSDIRRQPIATQRDSVVVRFDSKEPVASRTWRRLLRPGEYLYRVEAREPVTGRSARGLAPFAVRSFPRGQFALSDILVARRLQPRRSMDDVRRHHDLLVTPNASMTFAPGDTMFLYWETYGATPDSTGNGRLRVHMALRLSEMQRDQTIEARVLGGLADAVGLSPEGDDRVALRYERTVPLDSEDRVPNYLALGLAQAPFGTYTLELTVTDLVSGRTATQERTITIPRR